MRRTDRGDSRLTDRTEAQRGRQEPNIKFDIKGKDLRLFSSESEKEKSEVYEYGRISRGHHNVDVVPLDLRIVEHGSEEDELSGKSFDEKALKAKVAEGELDEFDFSDGRQDWKEQVEESCDFAKFTPRKSSKPLADLLTRSEPQGKQPSINQHVREALFRTSTDTLGKPLHTPNWSTVESNGKASSKALNGRRAEWSGKSAAQLSASGGRFGTDEDKRQSEQFRFHGSNSSSGNDIVPKLAFASNNWSHEPQFLQSHRHTHSMSAKFPHFSNSFQSQTHFFEVQKEPAGRRNNLLSNFMTHPQMPVTSKGQGSEREYWSGGLETERGQGEGRKKYPVTQNAADFAIDAARVGGSNAG